MEHDKRRSGKYTIVEVWSYKGGNNPIYNNISCIMDIGVAYQWEEIYYMFHRDSYPEVLDDDQDLGVYHALKRS